MDRVKKLLAIVVLGLLWSNYSFAEKIILFNCYPKNFELKTKGTTDSRIEIDNNNKSLLWIIKKDKTWVENKNKELKKNETKSTYRYKLKETYKYQIISNNGKVVIARDAFSYFSKEEKEEVEAIYEIKDLPITEFRVNLINNIIYLKSYYKNPPHYRPRSFKPPLFCKKK